MQPHVSVLLHKAEQARLWLVMHLLLKITIIRITKYVH